MNNYLLLLFLYKVICILSGVAVIFLGYRLFVLGIFSDAGDLNVTWDKKSLLLRRAAPGTFFALFGAIIISVTIYKGLSFENTSRPIDQAQITGNAEHFLSDTLILK